jgi:plastocyanin
MDQTYSRTTLIATCVIVAILVFLAGIWYQTSTGDNDSSPVPSASLPVYSTPTPSLSITISPSPRAVLHTVSLTAQGPSPKILTINVGDAVSFVNNSNSHIWPASTNCPNFDAYRALNAGESYTLIFTAKATCKYSDVLLNQSLNNYNGTIIVQ